MRNKMNHLQRMVCLAITGAMSSTPLAAMESLLGFLPLHIHIESVAKREMYRLSVGKLTTISCYDKGHSKVWTELMNHDPILSAPSDFEGVNPFTKINFQVKFPRREEWTDLTTLRKFHGTSLCTWIVRWSMTRLKSKGLSADP